MSTARYNTARSFSANRFGFSRGQCTVRTASRGTIQPAPFSPRQAYTNARRQGSIRRLATALGLIVTTTIFIVICGFELRRTGYVMTLTDSSCPVGIYRLTRRAVARGELVEACLPDAVSKYGIERGYLAIGGCPNGAEPVIKIAGALSGDRVDLSSLEVRVNEIALPASSTVSRDSRGRRVQPHRAGRYETAPGQIWLFGLHDARSWDSRYFGPIPLRNVVGPVDPVFTMVTFACAVRRFL